MLNYGIEDCSSLYTLNDFNNSEVSKVNEEYKSLNNVQGAYFATGVSVEDTINFYIEAFEYILKRIELAERAILKHISTLQLDINHDFIRHMTQLNKALDMIIDDISLIQSDNDSEALKDFYQWFFIIRQLSTLFFLSKNIEYKEKMNSVAQTLLENLNRYKENFKKKSEKADIVKDSAI